MIDEKWRKGKGDRISEDLCDKSSTRSCPRFGNVSSKFLPINTANYFVTIIFEFLKDIRIRTITDRITEAIRKLTNVTVSGIARITFTVSFHNERFKEIKRGESIRLISDISLILIIGNMGMNIVRMRMPTRM